MNQNYKVHVKSFTIRKQNVNRLNFHTRTTHVFHLCLTQEKKLSIGDFRTTPLEKIRGGGKKFYYLHSTKTVLLRVTLHYKTKTEFAIQIHSLHYQIHSQNPSSFPYMFNIKSNTTSYFD